MGRVVQITAEAVVTVLGSFWKCTDCDVFTHRVWRVKNHLKVLNCNVQIPILFREALSIEDKVSEKFSPMPDVIFIF